MYLYVLIFKNLRLICMPVKQSVIIYKCVAYINNQLTSSSSFVLHHYLNMQKIERSVSF